MKQANRLVELLAGVPAASRQKAGALREDIEHFSGLLAGVASQTERRVFEGGSVPAAEKLVSIFEPHTEIICRGKSGKPAEFGRKDPHARMGACSR